MLPSALPTCTYVRTEGLSMTTIYRVLHFTPSIQQTIRTWRSFIECIALAWVSRTPANSSLLSPFGVFIAIRPLGILRGGSMYNTEEYYHLCTDYSSRHFCPVSGPDFAVRTAQQSGPKLTNHWAEA